MTPDQAASIPPGEVQQLAAHVHANDGSIVDRLGEVYSEHPALFKTLGAAALSIAMAKMAQNHTA